MEVCYILIVIFFLLISVPWYFIRSKNEIEWSAWKKFLSNELMWVHPIWTNIIQNWMEGNNGRTRKKGGRLKQTNEYLPENISNILERNTQLNWMMRQTGCFSGRRNSLTKAGWEEKIIPWSKKTPFSFVFALILSRKKLSEASLSQRTISLTPLPPLPFYQCR